MPANQVKRALLSVYQKEGLLDFARGLDGLGIQLISSGGTATALRAGGLPVVEVSDITGFPEILDGRVKTLHPKIHGGILARRDQASDRRTLEQYGINGIDLVCVNLYPFEQTIAKPGCTLEQAIENIDVGGPTMIRAAAKNYSYVYTVTRPQQYAPVLRSLRERACWVDQTLAEELAREAFAATARYDAAIYGYLAGRQPGTWPKRLFLEFRAGEPLRYGENPHQSGAVYWEVSNRPAVAALPPKPVPDGSGSGPVVIPGAKPEGTSGNSSSNIRRRTRSASGLSRALQVSGKELSFNNLYDADAAWNLVQEFANPAAVVIKHSNPCGAAVADDASTAFDRAYEGDPAAAYGGIVAFNRAVDETVVDHMIRPGRYLEVIIAPSFTSGAVRRIVQGPAWGKSVRLLAVGAAPEEGAEGRSLAPESSGIHEAATSGVYRSLSTPSGSGDALSSSKIRLAATQMLPLDFKRIAGGLLVQTADIEPEDPTRWKVVTARTPTDREYEDLMFAWAVARHVKSNAVVLAKDNTLIGVGAGQMKRLDSSFLATRLAAGRSEGAVVASDAFFPFRDGLDEVAAAGVTAVIQPGGSKRDDEVVKAADQHKMAMVFTGRRHFKH